MNILITSAGRRVSLLRSFQKEYRLLVPQGKVFAADSAPHLSAACQIADRYFKVPRLDHPDYINILLDICKTNKVCLIIPTIDTELLDLAENRENFEENGIGIAISSASFVRKCRNKRITQQFFKEIGIKVAKEYTRENLSFPLFIKPVDGSRSMDIFIINSKEELTTYHLKHQKLMFLEYLDHNLYDEYTCDLYFGKDHQLKCVVPRKRIAVREGEVYKALTRKNDLVQYIKERFNYIEGAVGCLTAQFFRHKIKDGLIYGIEINPRFGGGYPLTYLSGANYTKWIIEEHLLGKKIDNKFDVWENNLLMIRYDDEVLVHGYKS